jgi:hypothetical protein
LSNPFWWSGRNNVNLLDKYSKHPINYRTLICEYELKYRMWRAPAANSRHLHRKKTR